MKKILLDYLRTQEIVSNTIYEDFIGFIQNEENYQSAQLYFYKGLVKGKNKDYAEAIADYTEAIRINPNDAEAHYRLALVCLMLNNSKKAKEHYKIGETLNPALVEKLKTVMDEYHEANK